MTLALREVHVGDCRSLLRQLPDESVNCVVTSPPYWGLRDYGLPPLIWGGDPGHRHSFSTKLQTAEGRASNLGPKVRQVVEHGACRCGAWRGSLGLEPTPYMFVEHIVEVFREVRRVLRRDGTVWLNLGDSYATGSYGGSPGGGLQGARWTGDVNRIRDVKRGYRGDRLANGRKDQAAVLRKKTRATRDGTHAGKHTGMAAMGPMIQPNRMPIPGLKPKDLVGVPWRVAFALQEDGWWLRMDNVWCLSGGAWVYARTTKGDMPIMVKDLVRLSPSTVKLWNGESWTRVLGWNLSIETSERLEMVLRSGERVGCTGGHQWPTNRGLVCARDIKPGDVIASCSLPEPDGVAAPGYLTEHASWLIGLYLAEGSRSLDTIQLALNADEAAWIPQLRMAVEHLGGTLTSTVDGNSLAVRIHGRLVVAMIETYVGGATALDKHLTNAAWRLPNKHLVAVATGYLAGDGHFDAKNKRWRLGFCRNYALERDLRTLAARLDCVLTLKPTVATYQGGKRAAFRGEWRWERTGHQNNKSRGEVVAVRASRARQFWDIGVEDEPHLFALASGILTHNSKPNPMPESVKDRTTRAHEYVFLLSRSADYFYDGAAIAEPMVAPEASTPDDVSRAFSRRRAMVPTPHQGPQADPDPGDLRMRNKRSVWSIASQPYDGAHFATFPTKLVEPCILAGCPAGGVVLDPFGGSGTVGQVAEAIGRQWILLELNPEYAALARTRTAQRGLFVETAAPPALEAV